VDHLGRYAVETVQEYDERGRTLFLVRRGNEERVRAFPVARLHADRSLLDSAARLGWTGRCRRIRSSRTRAQQENDEDEQGANEHSRVPRFEVDRYFPDAIRALGGPAATCVDSPSRSHAEDAHVGQDRITLPGSAKKHSPPPAGGGKAYAETKPRRLSDLSKKELGRVFADVCATAVDRHGHRGKDSSCFPGRAIAMEAPSGGFLHCNRQPQPQGIEQALEAAQFRVPVLGEDAVQMLSVELGQLGELADATARDVAQREEKHLGIAVLQARAQIAGGLAGILQVLVEDLLVASRLVHAIGSGDRSRIPGRERCRAPVWSCHRRSLQGGLPRGVVDSGRGSIGAGPRMKRFVWRG
jgi:hypothetical protein